MQSMVLDDVGIDFMKKEEGIPKNRAGQVVAYQDERGIWTIGYGHTQGVYKGLVWSVAKAESVFKSDINNQYGKCVNMYIRRPMTQNQFNAMTDLCYNIGTSNDPKNPGFPQSQVCKKFNDGDISGASKAFMGWIKPISLVGRRQREIKLFNTNPAKAPLVTDKNQDAVNKAKAQKQANDLAEKKLQDKLTEQDRKDEIAEKEVIRRAELSKDQRAITIAKAKAKANEISRKQASELAKTNKLRKEKADALALKNSYNSNNPKKNTPSSPADAQSKTLPNTIMDISKAKVLKSGLSVIGLLAIVIIMGNAEVPTTELE